MISITPVIKLTALFLLGILCTNASFASNNSIKTVTTILPYKRFIESAGKKAVTVTVLIPPGASPHTFELTPHQLKAVSDADMFVKVGSGIEFELVWMEKILAINKNIVVCNSAAGIDLIEKDPHVWLSPANAQIIVKNIADSLIQIDPKRKKSYRKNSGDYIYKLKTLDAELDTLLSDVAHRSFISFHPAWNYFARDYTLFPISIEDEGKEISPRQIARVIDAAKKLHINTILIAPQTNPKIAKIIAEEIKGTLSYADPFAEDYILNLREVSRTIAQSHE